MGSHSPRNWWSQYFSGSAAETVLQDPHRPHPQPTTIINMVSVGCVSPPRFSARSKRHSVTPIGKRSFIHALSQSLLGNRCFRRSWSTAAVQLWLHSDTAFFFLLILIPFCHCGCSTLSDTWLSAAWELALSPPWAGEGAPGSPSEQLFSGENSVWVTFWFWKIFCCAYLQSKSSIVQLNSCLADSRPCTCAAACVHFPWMCTQEYSRHNHWTNKILISPVRSDKSVRSVRSDESVTLACYK